MRIVVACIAREREWLVALDLPNGSTVADAVRASRLAEHVGIDALDIVCGIHGRRASIDTPLSEGDRVDITRPLLCDAKVMRRRRALANTPKPR
jgi:uncharacterized protein